MASYVAFLRAINVAGHPRVKMADLERAFTAAGCTGVESLIATGNVLFDVPATTKRTELFDRIRARLKTLIGDEASVFFRTVAEIEDLARATCFAPFEREPGIKLYVSFLARTPRTAPKGLRSVKEMLDVVAIEGREAFIISRRIPNRRFYGMPNNFIEAELGVQATTRNRSTLIKIADRARRARPGAGSARKSR